MFFLLGYLVEETPCERGENMQTPHRKAREISYLSTEGLGRTNSAQCGNRTHDLLAVRLQCKQCEQLSHCAKAGAHSHTMRGEEWKKGGRRGEEEKRGKKERKKGKGGEKRRKGFCMA